MKVKVMNWMLLSALVCGLSLSIASCKDDDNDKSEKQKEQEALVNADKFWDVVGQLVSSSDYTADYQNKTFEPVYGIASTENPTVRIVNTNNMEAAAQRFADLVGVSDEDGFNDGTATYTWKLDGVGSMTYTKTDNGQSWAEVDVNIKQVPRLTKIIYQEAGAGTNGSFDGTAYYRFGDVISRTVTSSSGENGKEYWICVRPAFGPEGKKTSHWVSVSPLPAVNVWKYDGSNKKHYALPTGIGTNKEHMQNFAEMLYAILNPADWETNVKNHQYKNVFSKGIKMFHDFDNRDWKYHNQNFWKRVDNAWNDKNLWKTIFGLGRDEMAQQITGAGDDHSGLYLLYKGYSWWTSTSWDCTLYQAQFQNGEELEANMHDATYTNVKEDMEYLSLDVSSQCTFSSPFLKSVEFFDDSEPRWIVRHATGEELAQMGGSGYGEKTPIAPDTFSAEYVYNAYNYQDAPNHFIDMSKKELEISTPPGDTNIPSVAKEQVQVGHVIGNNGKFYTDAETCVDATKANPVAAVLYVGEKGSVEEGKDYFGMAMSLVELNNDGNGYTWSDSNIDEASICAPIAEEGKYSTYKNGIATTASMAAGCNANHTHLAAQACHNYTALGENARNQNGFSDWFIPSTGQWIMMAKNVGYTWQENENLFSPKNNGVYATWLSGQTFYKYMSARSISGIFWLSNTMNESHYYAYTFNLSYFTFSPTDNTHTSNVRPFIAF